MITHVTKPYRRKKLLLILFYIVCFFFLSVKLFAQSNQTVPNGGTTTAVNFSGGYTYNWVKSNLHALFSVALKRNNIGSAPNISYQTPQVYQQNTPIAPLAPQNAGGAVPAPSPGEIIPLPPFEWQPLGMAIDGSGNIYEADNSSNQVVEITPSGAATTLPFVFNNPQSVVIDANGNIYVGDQTAIYKITSNGVKTVFAPMGTDAMTIDRQGNIYAISGNVIKKITPVGVVTTFAGGNQGSQDGPGSKASFYEPRGLAVDAAGNVFVADFFNNKIREITPDGLVTTFAGSGVTGNNDGMGTLATFDLPVSLAFDGTGNLYVEDPQSELIRKIDPLGNVTTMPGYFSLFGIAFNSDGQLYATNPDSHSIDQIVFTGYTIDKPLPPGLTFDSATGIISGTPTSPSPSTNYTVTAYNANGSNSTVVNITVSGINPEITVGNVRGAILTCAGSPSANPNIQQFTVSGSGLTNNITVKASVEFEVSVAANGGYGSNLTIAQASGIVNNTIIYVRSAATDDAGNISGNVVLASTGAANQNVTVSGTINAIPTENKPGSQTLVNGSVTAPVNFTGTANAYSWTNDTPSIGLASSGTGNISSFTAINTGNAPVTATITVTPEMPSFAYIANDQEALSVIDLNTNTVVANNIQVGISPIGTVVDKYNNRVYVANQQSQNISVINSITNTVTATIDIRPGWDPSGLALSPDGTRLYVTEHNNNFLTVINTADNSIIASIPVGQNPWGLAVSPDGNLVYVVDSSDNNVSIVNTTTNKVIGTISLGKTPNDIQISPDGSRLYVTETNDNTVAVINTQTNGIIATINTGVGPLDEAISPDGSRLYVTDVNDNTVTVINTLNNSAITTVNVNQHPEGLCFSADGTKVYVINFLSRNLSIINTSDNTVTTGISVGTSYTFGKFISSGSGCPGMPVTFTITVNPALPPTVTADGSLTPLTTIYGSPSSINRFTVSGTAITSGILITPPAGFEVSLDEKAFSPSVAISGTGNIFPTAVFIRLAASTHVGSYSGNVTMSTNNAADATIMVPVSTVTRASLTITADNKTLPFGVVNPPLTVTYSGFVNNDSADQLTTLPTLTTDATISSAVGQYAINVNHDAASPDYMFNYNPGILTVTPVLSALSIPNTFTPNGDGINDTWVIQDLEYYPKSTINIFNRWGQKVFTSIGYPIPWDGTYQGKTLSSGTYYYIIDPKNGQAALAGWVAIIR